MEKKDRYALTDNEIEDIKDEAVFRYKVMRFLKEFKGVPGKVLVLGVSQTFQWGIIILIIAAIFLKGN